MRTHYTISFAAVAAGVLCLLLVPVSLLAAPRVHSSAEVLEHFCYWKDGRLLFASPTTGQEWVLVTSVDDPSISNRGDGTFHPILRSQVVDALSGLSFSVQELNFDVYLLPYPRLAELKSSAGQGAIYLSPGTRETAEVTVHALVAHEVGHQIHRAFLPDTDVPGWEAYARLRGFRDDPRFSSSADHAFRPREVFAEDFRALFGSESARSGATLENPELVWPSAVAGLAEFMRRLPERVAVSSPLAAYPNPFFSNVRVEIDLGSIDSGTPSVGAVMSGDGLYTMAAPASLKRFSVGIHDARGRLVKRVPVEIDASGRGSIRWDGRNRQETTVSRGIYFARLLDSRGEFAQAAPLKLVYTR